MDTISIFPSYSSSEHFWTGGKIEDAETLSITISFFSFETVDNSSGNPVHVCHESSGKEMDIFLSIFFHPLSMEDFLYFSFSTLSEPSEPSKELFYFAQIFLRELGIVIVIILVGGLIFFEECKILRGERYPINQSFDDDTFLFCILGYPIFDRVLGTECF